MGFSLLEFLIDARWSLRSYFYSHNRQFFNALMVEGINTLKFLRQVMIT